MVELQSSALAGCDCLSSVSEAFNYHDSVTVDASQSLLVDEESEPCQGLSSAPFEFVIPPQPQAFVHMDAMMMREER